MTAILQLKKALLWLYNHIESFLILLLTFMLVTDVLLGVLARYVHFEVVFVTELGKYLFIWLCAIGISAAAKDHQHIRLDFFAEKLRIPDRLSWILSQCLFLVFSLFFCYWGLQLTLMHVEMNKSAMGFQFPLFIFTAAIPLGFFLTSFRLITDIIRNIKNQKASKHPIQYPDS